MRVLGKFQGCVRSALSFAGKAMIFVLKTVMDFKSKFSSGSKFRLRHFIEGWFSSKYQLEQLQRSSAGRIMNLFVRNKANKITTNHQKFLTLKLNFNNSAGQKMFKPLITPLAASSQPVTFPEFALDWEKGEKYKNDFCALSLTTAPSNC